MRKYIQKIQLPENKLQWIAIGLTAFGLITTTHYNVRILKATRFETEIAYYLNLNERYHKLLFTLLHNDPEVFKKSDDQSLETNKYIIYELFELLATVKSLENYYEELGQDLSNIWQRRVDFLFSKPAVQHAWQIHEAYAQEIYKPEFVSYIQGVIAQKSCRPLLSLETRESFKN